MSNFRGPVCMAGVIGFRATIPLRGLIIELVRGLTLGRERKEVCRRDSV